MTANPTIAAQQPTEAEYEAYLDSLSSYDDNDLVSTRTWIRRHTVSDRDVANLARELDAVDRALHSEDALIECELCCNGVVNRMKLDHSTVPYLRYLAARAASVVDRIDMTYWDWAGVERLDPVRERALELIRLIHGEIGYVVGLRSLLSLHVAGADGYASLAGLVRAECPDLAERFRISTQADDSDPREFVCVDDLFVMDYDRGGARYAVLASLVYKLYEDTLPDCQQCGCRDDPSGWSCGGCETALPLPDAYAAAACLRSFVEPRES